MGDRSNIKIVDSDEGSFYFYSHWKGAGITQVLQRALARSEDRWNDPSYLARIIFCDLVEGSERDKTGYGISTFMPDNGHPVVIVDMRTGTVRFDNEESPTWTFREYVELDPESLPEMLDERWLNSL